MLFNVLRAFSNRPFDPSLDDDGRLITATDVSEISIMYGKGSLYQ